RDEKACAGSGLYRLCIGRRFAARAGRRRRNHEGGQGYRRFRAPLVWGEPPCRRGSRRATIACSCIQPRIRSDGSVAPMSSKRRSYEAGHKRKYLVVIDDTEECDRAVYWAAKRAGRTKSQIVMLRVIEPGDRNQQWLGVADIM